jgi:ferredoxin
MHTYILPVSRSAGNDMKRKIITIDEKKCTGCGLCIPDCPEGALQLLEGKARLVSDLFCDGLGACIGTCPEGAITVVEREAGPYDENAVMENIVRQGEPVVGAHLTHLLAHGEMGLYNQAIAFLRDHDIPVPLQSGGPCSTGSGRHAIHLSARCPGSAAQSIARTPNARSQDRSSSAPSELRQWPVQLRLLNPAAPYFDNADLLITADCVPFAYGDFHRNFLKDKIVIIFCPKLDADIDEYITKLAGILSLHTVHSITVLHMEVPCCSGVRYVVDRALEQAGQKVPLKESTITIQGKVA